MMAAAAISSSDIRRICGDIPDWKVVAIQATGVDINSLEEAVAWSTGDDETPPIRHLPPESAIARVCDILVAGEEQEEYRER